jgi:hypothetical protein
MFDHDIILTTYFITIYKYHYFGCTSFPETITPKYKEGKGMLVLNYKSETNSSRWKKKYLSFLSSFSSLFFYVLKRFEMLCYGQWHKIKLFVNSVTPSIFK